MEKLSRSFKVYDVSDYQHNVLKHYACLYLSGPPIERNIPSAPFDLFLIFDATNLSELCPLL